VKKFRKAVIAISLVMATGIQSTAFATGVPDEQFVPSSPTSEGRHTGINLADDKFAPLALSLLEATTGTSTDPFSQVLTKYQCRKIGAPGCEPEKYFVYRALLGNCDATILTDCINGVTATNAAGREFSGTFVEKFPGETPYTYQGDASINLPTGSSAFIVNFPEIAHKGGTQYLVVAHMQGSRGVGKEKFEVDSFNSAIYAVSKLPGSFSMIGPENNLRPDHTLRGGALSGGTSTVTDPVSGNKVKCLMASPSYCAISWPLPLDVNFGLTLKFKQKIKGWLHGRIDGAEAVISSASDGDQLLKISGKPVIVPGIFKWFKKTDLPTPLKNYYATVSETYMNTSGSGWGGLNGEINGPDGLPYSIMKENFGYTEGAFREVSAWIDAVGDKATYAPTVWTFRSIEGQQYENCMKGSDSLSGFVTTNSTMYIGNPPTFDKEAQTLDYKVMAPHYLPDGSEFKGSYDLQIKSDVARCIYGFSNAPISASVSIISSDGTSQVATTVVNERDGWLTLSAKGFTFSAPTVRVKLSQKVEAAPVKVDPAPVAAPKPKAKKITISCVKGKAVKKVTAVKPTCPAGFKKK
jgi:hypothetical protein